MVAVQGVGAEGLEALRARVARMPAHSLRAHMNRTCPEARDAPKADVVQRTAHFFNIEIMRSSCRVTARPSGVMPLEFGMSALAPAFRRISALRYRLWSTASWRAVSFPFLEQFCSLTCAPN